MPAPQFSQIPDNILLPGIFIEFEGVSSDDVTDDVEPVLMFAPKTSAGTADADVPVRVNSAQEAKGLLGVGSFGQRMVEVFRKQNALKELWVIPIADAGGGVKALWTFSVTSTDDNDPGNIVLYIGGQIVNVPVNADSLAATIVQDIIDEIDRLQDLPIENVTGLTSVTQVFTAATSDVLTAVAHGLAVGNRITVANSGGALPAGLAAATTYLVATVPTADTFTLESTAGVAVDITSTGTGTHTLTWIDKKTFTVHAMHAGTLGNDIDIRLNYLGSMAGQKLPTGVGVTWVATTPGSTDPTLTAGITAMGDEPYDYVVTPWSDATVLDALETVMDDRWRYNKQIYGHVFSVKRDTAANLETFGATRNNRHETIPGVYDFPTPVWEIVSAMVGQMSLTLDDDPALPEQGIRLAGVLPPKVGSTGRFTDDVRQALLDGGVATIVAVRQQAFIERMITTYQTDENDAEDKTYLDIQTLFTLMRVARFFKRRIQSKFRRKKLASDNSRLPASANLVSPLVVRNECVAIYSDLIELGWTEDLDWFKTNIDVVRPGSNPNRLDILFPDDLVNQLRTVAAMIRFRR